MASPDPQRPAMPSFCHLSPRRQLPRFPEHAWRRVREIANKLLAALVAENPEPIRRLEREAKVLDDSDDGFLNHFAHRRGEWISWPRRGQVPLRSKNRRKDHGFRKF